MYLELKNEVQVMSDGLKDYVVSSFQDILRSYRSKKVFIKITSDTHAFMWTRNQLVEISIAEPSSQIVSIICGEPYLEQKPYTLEQKFYIHQYATFYSFDGILKKILGTIICSGRGFINKYV